MEFYKKLAAICCLLAVLNVHGTNAQNTFLPVAATLVENSATVSQTLVGSGGTGPYTFTGSTQTPNLGWFDVSSAGVISLASGMTVDFEEGTLVTSTYTIDVSVVDTVGAAVVVTFTYTITNVNEVPVFGSGDASAVKLTASQAAGSTIATIGATDPEADTITYTISDTTNFAISTVGLVTVNTGVTLASTTKYTAVYAADDAATVLTATTHLFVCIGTTCACNTAAAITRSFVTAIGVLVTLLIKLT